MRVPLLLLRLAVIFWNLAASSALYSGDLLLSSAESRGGIFLSVFVLQVAVSPKSIWIIVIPFKWLTRLRIIIYETWTAVLEEIQHRATALLAECAEIFYKKLNFGCIDG
jgi:hypothetical protein